MNFGEEFVAEPNLSLLKNCRITLPLKRGALHIEIGEKTVFIRSSEIGGTLKLNGKTYVIGKGEELYVDR